MSDAEVWELLDAFPEHDPPYMTLSCRMRGEREPRTLWVTFKDREYLEKAVRQLDHLLTDAEVEDG